MSLNKLLVVRGLRMGNKGNNYYFEERKRMVVVKKLEGMKTGAGLRVEPGLSVPPRRSKQVKGIFFF